MASSNQTMTSADVARLPLKQIEAALHKTTEALATELATPTEAAPDWTDFEWRIARAAAAMHGVSPLLAGTLRWRGPESWERFIADQREHTFKRHQRIAGLLADIGSQAVRDGIAMVPLKGAALHDIGIYQPGERPMSDIDLLVNSDDLPAATRLLNGFGYHEAYTTWRHGVFEPQTATELHEFGEHASNIIKIEIHTRIVERLPVVDRDISAVIFPHQTCPGLNRYPSNTALMIHLLTHAAGAMCSHSIRLLHLHDIALVARRMNEQDWEEVFVGTNGEARWWVLPPLMLMATYFSNALPAGIATRLAAHCPWLLHQICRRQTLSDVSLSNLWIKAFPGYAWSRSTGELLSYVMSRIKPDRTVLVGRRTDLKNHPSSMRFSWPYLSQGRRIVQWILSRPPRVATLSSVCAVLNSQPRLMTDS